MTNKQLLVIANTQTVSFFRLLGAQGMIIENPDDLHQAFTKIESDLSTIGGLLLEENLTAKNTKALDKIISLGIPLISIPRLGQKVSLSLQLEKLMIRAIGMKLNKGD